MYPEVFALLEQMDKRQRAEQIRVWCQSSVLAKHANAVPGAVARVPSVESNSDGPPEPLAVTGEPSKTSQRFGVIEVPDVVRYLMR